jgi:exosortase E/protease (VPEID-CTERM system)
VRLAKFRLLLLTVIFCLQIVILKLNFATEAISKMGWWWALPFSYLYLFIGLAIICAALVALLVGPRARRHYHELLEATPDFSWVKPLAFQIVAWIGLVVVSHLLFGQPEVLGGWAIQVALCWVVLAVATAVCSLRAIAPTEFWRKLFEEEKSSLVLGIFGGLCGWGLSFTTQVFWEPMGELTYVYSRNILLLIYPELIHDWSQRALGAPGFVVTIAKACSGYEGIGLIVSFVAVYLSAFRKEFRFPHALILFPIGMVTIWLFNILRIVVLIHIGISFSPDIAIGGFHSHAGWIAFIIVAMCVLALAHRVPFIVREPSDQTEGSSLSYAQALLVPFVVLLAVTLLTSAFSADFDWLYPVRVITTGLALWICWRFYQLYWDSFNRYSVLIGVAVFAIWMLLVDPSAEQARKFNEELFPVTGPVVGVWLMFRFIGSVITVPLAEELAFRGYLLAKLGRQRIDASTPVSFSWLALLVSSVLFGLLHGAWLAGTIAGLFYAIARYRRGSLGDAVVAHMVTNALLSCYVLMTGEWGLW